MGWKMFPIRVIDNQKQTKTDQPKEKKKKTETTTIITTIITPLKP